MLANVLLQIYGAICCEMENGCSLTAGYLLLMSWNLSLTACHLGWDFRTHLSRHRLMIIISWPHICLLLIKGNWFAFHIDLLLWINGAPGQLYWIINLIIKSWVFMNLYFRPMTEGSINVLCVSSGQIFWQSQGFLEAISKHFSGIYIYFYLFLLIYFYSFHFSGYEPKVELLL